MRIPAWQPYRAFPELDRFDDDRCREFAAHARRNRWMSYLVALLTAGLSAVATWLGVGMLWTFALSGDGGPYTVWLPVVVISTTLFSGMIVGLVIRDRWLRWAIGQQIDAARCPACRYALLGIPAAEGIITCPECAPGGGWRTWT